MTRRFALPAGRQRPGSVISAVVVLLTLASPAAAQEVTREVVEASLTREAARAPEGGLFLTGETLPRAVVVGGFFVASLTLLRDENARGDYLEMLGLGRAPRVAELLSSASERAAELRARPIIHPELDGDEAVEYQRRAQVGKARELGRIYEELLAALDALGESTTALEEHVEGPIRRSLSIWLSDPAEVRRELESLGGAEAAFEQGRMEVH